MKKYFVERRCILISNPEIFIKEFVLKSGVVGILKNINDHHL